MSFFELFILAIGLSMDAFAVAMCKGLAVKKVGIKQMLTVGVWFGSFQAIMPLIGYVLISQFQKYIEKYDHWIAFVLLALIGANMIKEALSKEEESADASFSVKSMLVLAVATSIDAMAAGCTLATKSVSDAKQGGILVAVLIIGVITFSLSMVGVKIGNVFGVKYKSKAELAGGIILILLGTKILLEHLGILCF
ncbi:MAG: manganese efflux pump [Clostridia bacterium]|nr:manganese efflux pump [Clostridia bacterium]